MKIALFHNLPLGGAKRAVYEMAVKLVEHGHSIHEYCFSTSDQESLPIEKYAKSVTVIPLDWSPLMKNRVPMMTSYLNLWISLRNFQKLAAASKYTATTIEKENYDIIFVNDCKYSLNPFILNYVRKPSVFYNHHGALWKPPKQSRVNKTLLGAARELYTIPTKHIHHSFETWMEFHNIKAAEKVLVNSKFAQKKVFEKYVIPSEVVYLGVDALKFSPVKYQREPFFLCVGAITYQKGYWFLLEALAQLPKSKQLPLVIVANIADPIELSFIQKFAFQKDLRIDIIRITSDNQLVELYNRASVFLYSPINEPFGLALLEAMACGTPIVCVDEGGPSEIMINHVTGILCNRNPQEFAEAIEELIDHKDLANQFGQQASEFVSRQWTWDHTANRLEKIFSDIVN